MKPPSKPTTPGQELVEAIARSAPPERLAEVIADALSATITSRAGTREPDTRSQLEAAKLLLAYSVGRPVERVETVNVNLDADSSIGLAERLRNSPALLKSLRAIIEQVEK